jgi:hypothetical protein
VVDDTRAGGENAKALDAGISSTAEKFARRELPALSDQGSRRNLKAVNIIHNPDKDRGSAPPYVPSLVFGEKHIF